MEFFAKEKLARIDEERQRRRKQRADEAIRRLEEVGKRTLALTGDAAKKPDGADDPARDGSGRRPGGLSRVLMEAVSEDTDPRRSTRRAKRAAAIGRKANADGQSARGQLDQAMQAIQGSVAGTAAAGLMGGLEAAARQISGVMAQVSSMANGGFGAIAESNPLADLMKEEREEQDRQGAPPEAPPALEHHAAPASGIVARGALGEHSLDMTLEVGSGSRDDARRPAHAPDDPATHATDPARRPHGLGVLGHIGGVAGMEGPQGPTASGSGPLDLRGFLDRANPSTLGAEPTRPGLASFAAAIDPHHGAGGVGASGVPAQLDPRALVAQATGLASQLDPRDLAMTAGLALPTAAGATPGIAGATPAPSAGSATPPGSAPATPTATAPAAPTATATAPAAPTATVTAPAAPTATVTAPAQ
jgi:hypothetical protein